MTRVLRHLPNVLSGLRLAAAPVLLVVAWLGEPRLFLLLLALSFLTDAADGFLARRLGETSELGARLDSWGDFAVYLSLPVALWWLWPDVVLREAPFIAAIAASIVLPGVVALAKFHRLTSYHTWMVKLAALMVAFGLLVLFLGGPPWLLRVAAPVSVLAALEQMAISLMLPAPRSDVRSLVHLARERRGGDPD